jgi:hypothetical protein
MRRTIIFWLIVLTFIVAVDCAVVFAVRAITPVENAR